MVKFSTTKEFLDGKIKINFANNFAFKLQVSFKPVFAQKSTTIKTQQETLANIDLHQAVLGINTADFVSDDYNKYIVVSDPIKNKANLEEATSLTDIETNIARFSKSNDYIKVSTDIMDGLSKTYAQETQIVFMTNIINFLKDNQLFRHDFSQVLSDMNQMSFELKTAIENSK